MVVQRPRISVNGIIAMLAMLSATPALAVGLDDAQLAAEEGRYYDVVTILTQLIDSAELEKEDVVIAYSNRGIAYSLLEAYSLAWQDLRQAIKLDDSHALTQNHLGILAEHVDHNFDEAFTWYRKASMQGFAASQVNLANLYRDGTGDERDYAEALAWYHKAARQGYSMAYVPIGLMYKNGHGVQRNLSEAVRWFAKGAEAGTPLAHFELGGAYEKGRGVAHSSAKAVEHYTEAANLGHVDAQNSLAYMYHRGVGVKQDFAEAVKWYQLASDQGHAIATHRLAWILATCPRQRFCDGERALALAKILLEKDKSASVLDTLAAAYARTGRFDQAISTMHDVLSFEVRGSANYRNYTRRLESYQAGIPHQK